MSSESLDLDLTSTDETPSSIAISKLLADAIAKTGSVRDVGSRRQSAAVSFKQEHVSRTIAFTFSKSAAGASPFTG